MNRKIHKEAESSCEYILPDYMGDIKKLLFSRATVVPAGRFAGEGGVEISGTVEYELLYADTDNKLTAINASSDYTESFDIGDGVCDDFYEESKIVNLKIRVTGPRKITMKAQLESALTLCGEDAITVEGDVFSDGNEPERCTRVINYSSSSFKKSGEREYAELIEKLGEGMAEEVETLLASASVKVSDAKAYDGYVEIKGENVVSALIKMPDAPPFRIKKVIPFEERIEAEGVNSDNEALANGYASSVSISISEENGECSAIANIICEYTVELIENKSCEVVMDAYLTDRETKNKYRESEFLRLVSSSVAELSIDVDFDREGMPLSDTSEILAISAELRSISASPSKQGCEFVGEIIVSGVACETNVDGTVGYIPFKTQSSFCENVNINCQIPDGAIINYSFSLPDPEVVFDADASRVKCTAPVRIYVFVPTRLTRLYSSEIASVERRVKDNSQITVYYPKANETLFEVAKKHHTTAGKIALDNKLTESVLASLDSSDSLVGVKKLIIK